MPSKKLVASLPSPALLKERFRSFSMLDAVVAPDVRCFEYHPKWGKGQIVGAYKDGSGNELFAWFSKHGAVLRGFDHELPRANADELWKDVPEHLAYPRTEPAFGGDDITFLCWTEDREGPWTAAKSPVKDGSAALLAPFQRNFLKWAAGAYDEELDAGVVDRLWRGAPLDRISVAKLNADYDEKAIKKEAKLLGWKLDFSGPTPLPRQKSLPLPKAPPQASRAKTFGEAEFTVRVHRDEVKMIIHASEVVARAHVDVYGELFDLVKARLKKAAKTGA